MSDYSKPDFSKGGYYRKTYSRAYHALVFGLIVAGISAFAVPLFIGHLLALTFIYLEYIVIAICSYKWGTKPPLFIGAILGLADLVLLSPYVGNSALLQTGAAAAVVGFVALSIGFGNAGRIAKDFNQIKFSDQIPRAVDRDAFMILLDKELARVKRYRKQSSLAIMELKILDRMEKSYGPHQGELMLRQVQLVMVRQVRRCDSLAWLGGPYFALLLPETRREGAEIAIDRLKESLQFIPARSFLRLGIDMSDWRVSITELKGDDAAPHAALRKVALGLDPVGLQRIGLVLREFEVAL